MVKNLPKIVIDTNIYYSSLVYGGYPREIVVLASKQTVVTVASGIIIFELKSLLEKKISIYF